MANDLMAGSPPLRAASMQVLAKKATAERPCSSGSSEVLGSMKGMSVRMKRSRPSVSPSEMYDAKPSYCSEISRADTSVLTAMNCMFLEYVTIIAMLSSAWLRFT